jgi:hypothetical protein
MVILILVAYHIMYYVNQQYLHLIVQLLLYLLLLYLIIFFVRHRFLLLLIKLFYQIIFVKSVMHLRISLHRIIFYLIKTES